jgi:hypothetical protein
LHMFSMHDINRLVPCFVRSFGFDSAVSDTGFKENHISCACDFWLIEKWLLNNR